MQPKIYVAATAGVNGTTSALLHIEAQSDVYGWFLESADRRFSAAFFMLEDFYAQRAAVLYSSMSNDAYGLWIRDQPPAAVPVRCPVPEHVVHDLERLKSKLVQDWLCFAGEPMDAAGTALYDRHGMRARAVNIKPRRLTRLASGRNGWHHWSAGFDPNVLDYLLKFRRTEFTLPQTQ